MMSKALVAVCEGLHREEVYQVFLSRWQSKSKHGGPVPVEENEVRRVLRYYDKCVQLRGVLLDQTNLPGLRGPLRTAQRLVDQVNVCSFVEDWAMQLVRGAVPAVDEVCVRKLAGLRRCVQGIVDRVLCAAREQKSLLEMEGEDASMGS